MRSTGNSTTLVGMATIAKPTNTKEEEEEDEDEQWFFTTQENGCEKNMNISEICETNTQELLICKQTKDMIISKTNQKLYLKALHFNRKEKHEIMDLVRATDSAGQQLESSQLNKMRLAFRIFLRLILPLANGFARSLKGILDVRILEKLRNLGATRHVLTNMLAHVVNTISMSLSSVQVSHRIDPILRLIKLRKGACIGSISDTTSTSCLSISESSLSISPFRQAYYNAEKVKAEKSVTLNILAEPPAGTPIRADIILIHGLHGSQANTWKQGLWSSETRPVNFQRPPKPPLRPPKRTIHSRSNIFVPPHTNKRPRYDDQDYFFVQQDEDLFEKDNLNSIESFFEDSENFNEINMFDGLEYSYPTFRLRTDDYERLIRSESSSPTNESKETPSTPMGSQYSPCWPGDWLPLDCPGVRVIAVNYTTDRYLWRPVWKEREPRTNLPERAREMTELLVAQKVGYGHPIVWVGHSKGGLFVKQIIVDAWESGKPETAPFWRSARGVFFYSVPHRGSHLASITLPLMRRSVELIDIEKNSKYLLDLHRRFAGLYQMGHLKIEVFSFVETALTLMSMLYLRIVGVDSADPGIGEVCGLHLDHRQICKPRSRNCILYTELINMINKVC